jgi:hypothetical protein
VKRDTTFVITLGTRDFSAAKTTTALDLDSAGAHPHCALHRALHRATERDTLCELVRDVVSDELCIELGTLDLLDVDSDFLAGDLRELITKLVDFGSLLSDDDTGTSGMNRHNDLARLPLDADVGNGRVSEPLLQIVAKQLVLAQNRGEITVGLPGRSPRLGDSKTKADRMCLLSHYFPSFAPTTI